MSETIREKLNRIDHKCLDENLRFHDLRSLFEATAPRLSPQDKEEIKKVIQNTDDAETIAAVLQAKAMDDKNESLDDEKESEEKLIEDVISREQYEKEREELANKFDELRRNKIPSYDYRYKNLLKKEKELNKLGREVKAQETGGVVFNKAKLTKLIKKLTGLDTLKTHSTAIRGYHTIGSGSFTIEPEGQHNFRLRFYRDKNIQDEVKTKLIDLGFNVSEFGGDLLIDDIQIPRNESLEEKLIPAPQEVVDELINILNKYGFVLDDSFKVNPGKTFMGDTHMQVINPESLVDMSDEINIQDELSKYITQDLIDEIHDLDQKSDCPITWNFGPNKNGQVTGGLDIMKQYVEESYKDVYYVIVDKHGNQLSRPTKDDSELWDRVESRDPKGTRGLKVVVYTGKVDEKLDEASYGGAYDIEDDMFFTKEELMEFAGDLAEQYCAWANHEKVYIEDLYIAPGNWLNIELYDDDEGIYIPASVRIDMRKIKLPKDIYKYSDIILKQWKDSYNEYHQADEELFNENYSWEITYGKGRPEGNKEIVEFPTYKDARDYAANNDHGWGFDIKNLSLEKSNKSLKESEDSYFDYDEAVKYIESKGISADPTTYVGEYVCDMLDDFASDDETYSKEDLDSIINDVQQLIGETDSEASFNIIIDGQKLEDITAEDIKWAKEDIENANIDVNDVYEYHVNEDADYFIITFKDGTKKAWYIHSGMYIPDKDFIDESLKEDTVKQNGKWVNKGKEGTHGKFRTKKAADAQRRAIWVNWNK